MGQVAFCARRRRAAASDGTEWLAACDRSGPIVARQPNHETLVLGLVSEVKSNRRADKEPGNEQFAFWTLMLDREHIMSNFLFAGHSGKAIADREKQSY